MPTSLVRVDLDAMYPPFARAALEVTGQLHDTYSEDFALNLGFRSFAQSDALYAKYQAGGPKAAPGGASPHNYGLGADYARVTGGVYDGKLAKYILLGKIAEELGLVWGGHFGDADHVNWPGFTSKSELAPLLAIYQTTNDMAAVWAALDEICYTDTWKSQHPTLERFL